MPGGSRAWHDDLRSFRACRAVIDRAASRLIRPVLDRLAVGLVRSGIGADQVTLAGFALGMLAATAIAAGWYGVGAALVLASRLCDGLDGAVARATRPSDAGGFLDITLDFLFYAAVPLAFAWAQPERNALPAAVLLAAFTGTMSSFLAFAVLAARRGLDNPAYPDKAFYFLGGLTEAGETLACFLAMCIWPQHFPSLALGFAVLCACTAAGRVLGGWRALR